MPSRLPVRDNLRWSFAWTLWVATAFSGYVLIVSLLDGSTRFQRYGLSPWQIIATYYAAAVLAGVALGLLRPLTDGRLGAYLVGVLIGFSVYGAIGVSMYGLTGKVAGIAAICGLLVGGLGVVFHDQGPGFSAKVPRGRVLWYAMALLAAFVFLWLDMRYHIVNK